MGTLRAVFGFRDPDSTFNINATNRFISPGILSGGNVSNVPGVLRLSISPFNAINYEGMFILHEISDTQVTVTALLDQYVLVKAVYSATGPADLSFEVMTVIAYNALTDEEKAKRLRLARFTAGAAEVLDADIDFTWSDRTEPVSRSSFRGRVATTGDLPVDARWNNEGDFYLVVDVAQLYMWDSGTGTWVPMTDGALAYVFAIHRSNGGAPKLLTDPIVDENHLTDDEYDAITGAIGGALTAANPVISSDRPFADPQRITVTLVAGTLVPLPVPPANGPYYIGTGAVGSANQYFKLFEEDQSQPLRGTNNGIIGISRVLDHTGMVELDPSVVGPYYRPLLPNPPGPGAPQLELDFSLTGGDVSYTGNLDVGCGVQSSIGVLDEAAFLRAGDLALLNITDYIIAVFDSLRNGILLTSPPTLFRVQPDPTGFSWPRGYDQWNTQPYVGEAVLEMDTDGKNLYTTWNVGVHQDEVHAYNAETGVNIWNVKPAPLPGDVISAVCTDGTYCYVAFSDAIGGILYVFALDPDTGATIATYNAGAVSSSFCNALAANGPYVCAGQLDGNVRFWTLGIYQGTYDHSQGGTASAVWACAVDWRNVYIGGARSAGDSMDLRAIDLLTQAVVWSVALSAAAVPDVWAIATDGERVYVATDRVDIGGGLFANIFCCSVEDGRTLWTYDYGDTFTREISCDDKYIYCHHYSTVHVDEVTSMHDKFNGVEVFVKEGVRGICNDGISWFGVNETTWDTLKRNMNGSGTRIFMRVLGTDRWRRPFHHLAIPGTV